MLRGEHGTPARLELLLIAHLPRFHAVAQRTAVRDPLKMHHPRARLIEYLVASFPQTKRQITILAICWRVVFVEATQLIEQGSRHQQRRGGTVVHFAQVIVYRTIGAVGAAKVPTGAVLPDNAASLLQAAAGIQQL